MQGAPLTQADCISILDKNDGLWSNQDLVFVPDEVRRTWQRRAEIARKISLSEKDKARADLVEILKEAKRQRIRVLSKDAERWIQDKYKIEGKAFGAIWGQAREHPDVGMDRGGRPTEAQQKMSASFCKSYPKTLPRTLPKSPEQ